MRAWVLVFLAACGSSPNSSGSSIDAPGSSQSDGAPGGDALVDSPGTSGAKRSIFIIPMENEPSSAIYGNTTNAPYINTVISQGAYATMFQDELPALVSEPHYVWMEAGTNQFNDITFTTDANPSASHSTASTEHLVTQLDTAHISWMSYQQGMLANTCPVSGNSTDVAYAPKHDPMIFFQDISGTTPSSSTALCIAHHKPYSAFEADLAAGNVAQYVFITPDLCNDMHGDTSCTQGTNVNANIKAGDTWLKSELPRILDYANAHDGVVFVVWDEGDNSNLIPFLAFGPRIKTGPSGTVYTHSSQLKSVEEILGVPVLSTVTSANDFADMFQPGMFP
jgi:hypothetical protein